MKTHGEPCAEPCLRENLKAYLDEELGAGDRLAVRRHLAKCAACAEEARAMETIGGELRKLDAAEEPPADLRGRIMARLHFTPEPARRPTRWDLARWGALAAAAGIVAFIGYGVVAPELASRGAGQRVRMSSARAGLPPADAPASPAAGAPATAQGGAGSKQRRGPAAQGGKAQRSDQTLWNEPTGGEKRRFVQDFAQDYDESDADDGIARKNGDPYSPLAGIAGGQPSAQASAVTPEDVKKYARGKESEDFKRKVVQNADLSVRVAQRLETVQDTVAGRVKKDGGYVESAALAAQGEDRVTQMSLRVPVEKFEATVAWLSSLGEVQAKNVSGEDITETWVDQKTRTRGLRDKEARLAKEYDRARKPEAREAVRQRLAALRPRIAAAEERFAFTGKLAALAVIRLRLSEEPQARVRGSLLQDLNNTARSASAAFLVAVRIPAAVLIWLAVFAPLWLPCLLIYRWAGRMARAQQARLADPSPVDAGL